MIIIIGGTGCGKSTLAKAIECLSNIKCEVVTNKDLMEAKIQDIAENFKTEEIQIPVNNKRNKKGKEIKNWQKNKFY